MGLESICRSVCSVTCNTSEDPYLDDLITPPPRILLAIQLMLTTVLEESEVKADGKKKGYTKRSVRKPAAFVLVLPWIAIVVDV